MWKYFALSFFILASACNQSADQQPALRDINFANLPDPSPEEKAAEDRETLFIRKKCHERVAAMEENQNGYYQRAKMACASSEAAGYHHPEQCPPKNPEHFDCDRDFLWSSQRPEKPHHR